MVDWFTVAAQIVNFLILVALLKHFLYGRIIEAMDKREERIRSRLAEADTKKEEAEKEAESYRRSRQALEEKRDRIVAEAREEAERKRKELTREVREEMERARGRLQESLEKEKSAFLKDLRQLAAGEVYSIARKALTDLAGAELEERLVEVFVSRVKEMEKEHKKAVEKALQAENNKGAVRTGFELSTGSRQKLTRAIRDEIAEQADIYYETEPHVIMGIELTAGGEKVVWSVREYLVELEERAKDALEKELRKGEQREKTEKDKAAEKKKMEEAGEGPEKERESPQDDGEEREREKKEKREGTEGESGSDRGGKKRRKKKRK